MRHLTQPVPDLTDATLFHNVEPRFRSLQMRNDNDDDEEAKQQLQIPTQGHGHPMPAGLLTPTPSASTGSSARTDFRGSGQLPAPNTSASSPSVLSMSSEAPPSSNMGSAASSSEPDDRKQEQSAATEDLVATQPLDEHEVNPKSRLDVCWATLVSQNAEFKDYNIRMDKTRFGRGGKCLGVDFDISEGFDKKTGRPDLLKITSREHFDIVLEKETGDVFIIDLSSNGTIVNGERVIGKGARRPLVHGDIISIGDASNRAFQFNILLTEQSVTWRKKNDDSRSEESSEDGSDHRLINGKKFPKEITDRYIMKARLGSGGCGTVYVAYDRSSPEFPKVAVKELDRRPRAYEASTAALNNGGKTFQGDAFVEFQVETEILVTLRHPCVIGFKECIKTDEAFYIIMELAEGGELYKYVTQDFDQNELCEGVAKLQMYQILKAIEYCHARNVIHRDLKLENLLLETPSRLGRIKVSDFGLSKQVHPGASQMHSFVGTSYYLAPELVANEETGVKYSRMVDMWALGCVLYSLLCGSSAFEGSDAAEVKQRIKKHDLNLHFLHRISDPGKDLVLKLLQRDEKKRLTCTEALAHEWFTSDPAAVREAERVIAGEVAEADLAQLTNFSMMERRKLMGELGELMELDTSETFIATYEEASSGAPQIVEEGKDESVVCLGEVQKTAAAETESDDVKENEQRGNLGKRKRRPTVSPATSPSLNLSGGIKKRLRVRK